MFDFEKFPVYQESELFYLEVLKIFQENKISKDIKDQLKRASMSIVLNIAEGAGKYSKNDKKNFYIISRGSVNECVALLRILKLEKIIDKKQYTILYDKLLNIGKMLSGLINSMINK
ncbi:four helix bundle protein [Candidatus Uhrbacteria bacterium CG_4_9_14_3_um_filter_36_7]|uniref:Four helix bundle protein n=1 Tax=Candidatus Uhrbacteria bacterium CG_4_9_14_3_um_filter_36_7 TaxID=1975033 RepID=A0A2M7XHV0_9BACT|nr:MAG: four helix bundle protein [Candidatus Uhrbacteria bacterium CG_4_9_14_3_um_filter_36_7]